MKMVGLLAWGKREIAVLLVSMAFFFISSFIILGEDVFWKMNLVDTLYSNIGTNPGDVQAVVSSIGTFIIFVSGSFLSMFDWSE